MEAGTTLVERILELIELPSPQEVVAGAPEAVRAAIAAGDPEALGVALGAMPAAEAEALVERLRPGAPTIPIPVWTSAPDVHTMRR